MLQCDCYNLDGRATVTVTGRIFLGFPMVCDIGDKGYVGRYDGDNLDPDGLVFKGWMHMSGSNSSS